MIRKNLIIGGLGFIGSNLAEALLKNGEEVICLDNLSSGLIKNKIDLEKYNKFNFIKHDILYAIELSGIDRMWHLASPASPKKYQLDPIETAKINFIGTINALDLARKNNARILLTSSSECYGIDSKFPQDEIVSGYLNTKSRRSCYFEGKRIAETLFFDYERIYDLDIRVTRIFNTYGIRMGINDGRVISNFFFQAINGEPLTIYGDGNQTRSFCFIDDAIQLLLLIMDKSIGGITNIGNNEEISIIKLAKLINKLVGNRNSFDFVEIIDDEPKRRVPSLVKVNNLLGWHPKITLVNGLKKTYDYYKKII